MPFHHRDAIFLITNEHNGLFACRTGIPTLKYEFVLFISFSFLKLSFFKSREGPLAVSSDLQTESINLSLHS